MIDLGCITLTKLYERFKSGAIKPNTVFKYHSTEKGECYGAFVDGVLRAKCFIREPKYNPTNPTFAALCIQSVRKCLP